MKSKNTQFVTRHLSSVCSGPTTNFFRLELLLCGAAWRINGDVCRAGVAGLLRASEFPGCDAGCNLGGLGVGGMPTSWLSSNGWRSMTLTSSSSM